MADVYAGGDSKRYCFEPMEYGKNIYGDEKMKDMEYKIKELMKAIEAVWWLMNTALEGDSTYEGDYTPTYDGMMDALYGMADVLPFEINKGWMEDYCWRDEQ